MAKKSGTLSSSPDSIICDPLKPQFFYPIREYAYSVCFTVLLWWSWKIMGVKWFVNCKALHRSNRISLFYPHIRLADSLLYYNLYHLVNFCFLANFFLMAKIKWVYYGNFVNTKKQKKSKLKLPLILSSRNNHY